MLKMQIENTGKIETRKTSVPKDQVENANLLKPILNKIMSKQE